MKHLLLLIAFVVGIFSLPETTFAKDRDRKDYSKDLRNDFDRLQTHYSLVKDRVKNTIGADRRLWGNLQDIRRNIDSIGYQLSGDRYDGRELRDQIRRSNDDLDRVQAQLEYNSKRKGGYYKPY